MPLPLFPVGRAARQLLASRLFTATAVLTIALGIGGTTAIITLTDAIARRSLPVPDPERLYRIGGADDGRLEGGPQGRWGFFPFSLYERLRGAAPEFADITAFDWGRTLSVRRERTEHAARLLHSEYVTGSYFTTLGVGAFAGRVFTPDDDRAAAAPVVVLSHHVWREAYGSDASIVGASLTVEGHPFRVFGVGARGFFGDTRRADPPDLWIPLQHEPMIAGAGSLLRQSVSPWLFAIGRLRPGASVAGLPPRLSETVRQWIRTEAEYPASWMPGILSHLNEQTVAVVPAGAGMALLPEQYGSSLRILFAACALVLLVTCANVANLQLARAAADRAQTAVRLAMGASRLQILAEALTGSVLLALAGAVVGIPVAIGTARLLIALAFRGASYVPVATTPSIGVLGVTAALALVTGVSFGAAPAWLATRTDPIEALRGGGHGTSAHGSRTRSLLLLVQATVSVVVVAGSLMLGRSLANLEHRDVGFPLDGRVTVNLNRVPAGYPPPRLSALYRDVEERLVRLPGVHRVGLALYNPLTSNWGETVYVAGHPPMPRAESGASWDRVSAGYLQTLGTPLLRGRWFTSSDNEAAAPVAVVNESFVQRFFRRDENPIGQRFGIQGPENAGTLRIVGVAGDATFARSGLRTSGRPMFFVPLAQYVSYRSDEQKTIEALSHLAEGILLATDAAPASLEPLVRSTLASADPNLTIASIGTMRQQIELALDREQAVTTVAELFGVVTLLLAAVGAYGVTACMVARQTKDIGIRMALGARRGRVVGFVLARAFRPVAAGLVVGVPLTVAVVRLMASQLYGVSFRDPFALTVAAGSLAASTCLAVLVPAARAAAIPPVSALRAE
jgi:predicted permease